MATESGIFRFTRSRRIEHWTTVGSFALLVITGLPQKFHQFILSEIVLRLMGGIEVARILHRLAAVVMMLVAIYHLGSLIYYWFVERGKPHIVPSLEDAKNALESVKYNLGQTNERPRQGLFTFEEKFEYWALIWGTLVMILTGFFLWNPVTVTQVLSGEVIPAAKAAHGGEALLAVISILVWHLYHVLIKHNNRSMFTGYLSMHEMEEEHPMALERNEYLPPVVNRDSESFAVRQRQFKIGYGIVAAALTAGIVWIVTTETTASAEPGVIPDMGGITSFSPLAPTPFPTHSADVFDPSRIGTTWDDGIGEMISSSCGQCHQGPGSIRDLDLTNYQGLIEGGESGSAVAIGSPGASLVAIWPGRADHPVQWSPNQLSALRAWIADGAPQD